MKISIFLRLLVIFTVISLLCGCTALQNSTQPSEDSFASSDGVSSSGTQSTENPNPTTDISVETTTPPVTEEPATMPPTTEPPTTEPPTTEPPATTPPPTTPPNTATFLNTYSGTISINTANISLQDNAVLYITLSYNGSVSYACTPNDIVSLTWGDFDYSNTVPLYITASQNGTASIRIYETDYPNNYLTVHVTVSNHIAYDTSKASGILAQAGLTEQGFRNICTYIGSRYNDNNAYVYAAGQEYYAQHPEESKRIEDYTMYWYDYQINGTRSVYYTIERESAFKESNNVDDFLNYTVFGPKGASILGKQSEEILKGMQEYPGDYVNQPFLLKSFRTTYVSNFNYTDDCFVIYDSDITVVDYRDDVNYPRIQQGYLYDMYVIFSGINNYGDLVFALISVEKCA